MMFKADLVSKGNGNPWDDHSLGQVVGIVISYSSTSIHSLRFLCVKGNIQQMSEQHGSSGGNSEMILLDYPNEFLTAVHGIRDCALSTYSGTIKSLTFVTNKAIYGPIGQQRSGNNGIAFGFKFAGKEPRNLIVGFYGTVYGGFLNELGVYVRTPTTGQPEEYKPLVKRAI
nr:jacalin-related lectin 3-like [Ipomoea trifida]